jgi:hypothetical protein
LKSGKSRGGRRGERQVPTFDGEVEFPGGALADAHLFGRFFHFSHINLFVHACSMEEHEEEDDEDNEKERSKTQNEKRPSEILI